jgi:hypothetical protein
MSLLRRNNNGDDGSLHHRQQHPPQQQPRIRRQHQPQQRGDGGSGSSDHRPIDPVTTIAALITTAAATKHGSSQNSDSNTHNIKTTATTGLLCLVTYLTNRSLQTIVHLGHFHPKLLLSVDLPPRNYFTPSPPHPVESPPESPPGSHNTDIPSVPRAAETTPYVPRVSETTNTYYFERVAKAMEVNTANRHLSYVAMSQGTLTDFCQMTTFAAVMS